jgi:hypothetical protein
MKPIGVLVDFVVEQSVQQVLNYSTHQVFVLEFIESVASVVSKAVLNHTTDVSSAAHCQEGQGGKVYKLVPATSVDQEGGNRTRTRKRARKRPF